jgi:hypothetical protein
MPRRTTSKAIRLQQDPAQHCSLEERAWTDLTTNYTVLTGIDLEKDFEGFFQLGGFPTSSLPSLLHESVHHWCFNSAVGNALALLQLRCYSRVVEWYSKRTNKAVQRVIEDLMRFQTATTFLRPLAEGLALFAEYDALPHPHTKVISYPLELIYIAFTAPSRRELTKEFGKSLLVLLADIRLSEDYMRRKARLLLDPLSCEKSGYLAGYLMVKAMWQHARLQSYRFRDTDLFYSFLKRYFYGDYGFAGQLLQNRVLGPKALKAIHEYFRARLFSFLQLDLDSEAARYEDTVLSAKAERNDLAKDLQLRTSGYPPIGTRAATHKKGQRLLNQVIEDFLKPHAEPTVNKLHGIFLQILGQRHILRLGSLEVNLVPAKSGLVTVRTDDKSLFKGRAVKGWKPMKTRGMLSLYVSLQDHYKALVVSVEEKVVMLEFRGKVDAMQKKQFRGHLNSLHLDINNSMRETLEGFFDLVEFREHFDFLRDVTTNKTESLYAYFSLGWVGEKQRMSCYAKMEADGLYPILNNDLELLKSVARLSLAAATFMTEKEAGEYLPPGKHTVRETLEILAACTEEHGLPLIFGQGDIPLESYV